MKLFDVLVRQQRFVYLATAMLSFAGVWSAFRLPSAIYPELTFERITIVVQGSSLGARQVVFSITRPIEEALSIVPGIRRVQSRSIRGAGEITITFAPKTDMSYALQLVRARVNQIRDELPPNLSIEIERLEPSLFPIISYNLEGGDPATLYDIARYEIKPVISRVPGVGRVDIQASDTREIEVVADPARLAASGLTYADLARQIEQAIAVDAIGRVAKDYKQYLIVTDQEAHTVEDVENVVVANGLRVRDLARVTAGTEDHVRIIAGDGKPAALINITRQVGGNTVAIADSVARAFVELARTLPPGVHAKAVYDQAELVRDAVRSVADAMLIGAGLAVVILLVFLRHWRMTAISAAAIPLTLGITVFLMWLIGQTFNLMTLGAMAIAIGLVIDDAVVVTENIARHSKLNPDRHQAIQQAVQELIWPVTTSTITTVVVFLPLGLLQGVVGQFFVALSLTLTTAVLVSLILALTIIPLMSERFLRAEDVESRAEATEPRGWMQRTGRAIDGLSDRYERSLGGALHHPRIMLAGALAMVVVGVLLYRVVGTGFLPEMDEGAFVLDYFTPGGTALDETDRELKIVEHIMAETPEITGTSRRTGAEMGMFATAQNTGDIVARLKPHGDRERNIFAVMDDVRDQVTEAVPRMRVEFIQILSDVINDLAGAANPVEIKLFGAELDSLEAYAERLEPSLEPIAGLEDFYNGVSEPSAEMLVRVNETEAGRIGLSPAQIGEAVSGALLGVTAGEVRTDDRSYAIRVRAPDSVRFDPLRLSSLPVFSSGTRATAPLGTLVSLRTTDTRGELLRENQQQMIIMTADVAGRALGDIMRDVRAAVVKRPPPPGVRIEFGGQDASQREAFGALLMVLGLAAVSVVAVMVIQFESFAEPLIVTVVAPVSFVGALTLLLVTGTPVNVSSLMGLILLVGLIVKNGIILLDFTRHRMRTEGLALEPAIREAARIRLRPILMTTLCTLFGLLPLSLGLGAGSELQRPLALAVIGGLALSTPITLYVVPTLLVALRGKNYQLTSVLFVLGVLVFSSRLAVAQKPTNPVTPPPAEAPAVEIEMSGASVLIGTGDIGECSTRGSIATAKLMDSVLRADSAVKLHDEAFTLGDNAYPGGSIRDFAKCFASTWGDSAKLIMKNIRPAVGNHEYLTGGAAAYYQYFGGRAGPPTKGYYSYDVGAWHAIVLNSEIMVNVAFSSADRQAQLDWLEQDLKSNKQVCTVAYWHHPRFSSGWHGSDARLAPFWQLLYIGGADLVLGGHDHDYERFLPQTPEGTVDSTKGIVEIVSGTGGGDLRAFKRTAPLSAYRVDGHYGVLKLTLGTKAYSSAFLATDGTIWDRTGGNCH